MKMFEHIAEIAEDEQTLVLVLVDEVESIASSRSSSARSNEPGKYMSLCVTICLYMFMCSYDSACISTRKIY